MTTCCVHTWSGGQWGPQFCTTCYALKPSTVCTDRDAAYTQKALSMANHIYSNDGAVSGDKFKALRKIIYDKRFRYLPSKAALTLSHAFTKAVTES